MLVNIYKNRVLRAEKPTHLANHICRVKLTTVRPLACDDRYELTDQTPRQPTWQVLIQKPAGWMERKSWLVLRPKWGRDGSLIGIEDESGEQIAFERVRSPVPKQIDFF